MDHRLPVIGVCFLSLLSAIALDKSSGTNNKAPWQSNRSVLQYLEELLARFGRFFVGFTFSRAFEHVLLPWGKSILLNRRSLACNQQSLLEKPVDGFSPSPGIRELRRGKTDC